MRIGNEVRSLYVGESRETEGKTPEQVKESLKKGRVFVGKQEFGTDKIAERRKQAQEKAMNIVKTAFAGEQILDNGIADMERSIETGKEEMVAQKAELNRILAEKEALKERNDLTSVEYEEELAELSKAEEHFAGLLENGKKLENRTLQALSDIKIERAKENPMVNATKEAEAVLAEGNQSVIGMLFEEAKEKLEAEMEEKLQNAEKQKEEKEQREERLEKLKAEQGKEEELPGVESLERATKRMVKIAEVGEDVQKELKHVVDKLKLDLEDLKGAVVDEGI